MMSVPGLVIGGAHSGAGKTSVSIALARALTRRGMKVSTFKVGPDFLDPTYLAIASGRKCYNLDGWMMGLDYCKKLFAEKSTGADIALVEGVMGLFDGASAGTREGSTAEIAAALDAPVILVVGTHGMGGSVAPLVKGFCEFDIDVKVAGVIANHSGSESHRKLLDEALQTHSLPPLVGAVMRGAFYQLPGRHLGLVTADENLLSDELLDSLADALEQHVDIDKVLTIAKVASEPYKITNKVEDYTYVNNESSNKVRVAIARDEAFHFYYNDTLEALEIEGCELVEFSPIHDKTLPENISGLYIGGGYPELYAEKLSQNRSMLESVKMFADSGFPVYAECGGLMYLSRYIRAFDGEKLEMCRLLPFGVKMLERRRMLGYVEVELKEDSLWGNAGDKLKGHEFHYSEPEEIDADDTSWKTIYSVKRRRSGAVEREGFSRGNVVASYTHLHFASVPGAVRSFVKKCSSFVAAQ